MDKKAGTLIDYLKKDEKQNKTYIDFAIFHKFHMVKLNYLSLLVNLLLLHLPFHLDIKVTLIDYLKKDEKQNKTYIDKNGKEAILSYKIISEKNRYSLVESPYKGWFRLENCTLI